MIILRLQGLPWSATAKDIRQHFEGLSIPDGGVHIIGGEEGDVFIAFSSDEDARKAMQRQKQPLNGSRIILLLSSKSEMQEVIAESRAAAQSAKPDPFGTSEIVAPSISQASQQGLLSREGSVASSHSQGYQGFSQSDDQHRQPRGYGDSYQSGNVNVPGQSLPSQGYDTSFPPSQSTERLRDYGQAQNQMYGSDRLREDSFSRGDGGQHFMYQDANRSRSLSSQERNLGIQRREDFDTARQGSMGRDSGYPQESTQYKKLSDYEGREGRMRPADVEDRQYQASSYGSASGPRSSDPDMSYMRGSDKPRGLLPSPEMMKPDERSYQEQFDDPMEGISTSYPPAGPADKFDYNQSSDETQIRGGKRGDSMDTNFGPSRPMSAYGRQDMVKEPDKGRFIKTPYEDAYWATTTDPPSEPMQGRRPDDTKPFPHNQNKPMPERRGDYYQGQGSDASEMRESYMGDKQYGSAGRDQGALYDQKGKPNEPFGMDRSQSAGYSMYSDYRSEDKSSDFDSRMGDMMSRAPLLNQEPPMSSVKGFGNDPPSDSQVYGSRMDQEPPVSSAPAMLDQPTLDTLYGSKLQSMEPPGDAFYAVRLTGLPFSCTERDVTMFLHDINIAPDGMQIHRDHRGHITGTANVKLQGPSDIDQALKRHHQYMGKRYIDVRPCLQSEWEKEKSSASSEPSRRRSRSPVRGRKSPLRSCNTCIEIKGLPSFTKNSDIVDFFQGLSMRQDSIFFDPNRDGPGSGVAYVEFVDPDMARRACQKNGRQFNRRTVAIRIISKEIMDAKIVGDMRRRAERRSPGRRSSDRQRGSSPYSRRGRSPGRRGRSPPVRSSSRSSPGRNGPGKKQASPSRDRRDRDRDSSRQSKRALSPTRHTSQDRKDSTTEKKERKDSDSREVRSLSKGGDGKSQSSPKPEDKDRLNKSVGSKDAPPRALLPSPDFGKMQKEKGKDQGLLKTPEHTVSDSPAAFNLKQKEAVPSNTVTSQPSFSRSDERPDGANQAPVIDFHAIRDAVSRFTKDKIDWQQMEGRPGPIESRHGVPDSAQPQMGMSRGLMGEKRGAPREDLPFTGQRGPDNEYREKPRDSHSIPFDSSHGGLGENRQQSPVDMPPGSFGGPGDNRRDGPGVMQHGPFGGPGDSRRDGPMDMQTNPFGGPRDNRRDGPGDMQRGPFGGPGDKRHDGPMDMQSNPFGGPRDNRRDGPGDMQRGPFGGPGDNRRDGPMDMQSNPFGGPRDNRRDGPGDMQRGPFGGPGDNRRDGHMDKHPTQFGGPGENRRDDPQDMQRGPFGGPGENRREVPPSIQRGPHGGPQDNRRDDPMDMQRGPFGSSGDNRRNGPIDMQRGAFGGPEDNMRNRRLDMQPGPFGGPGDSRRDAHMDVRRESGMSDARGRMQDSWQGGPGPGRPNDDIGESHMQDTRGRSLEEWRRDHRRDMDGSMDMREGRPNEERRRTLIEDKVPGQHRHHNAERRTLLDRPEEPHERYDERDDDQRRRGFSDRQDTGRMDEKGLEARNRRDSSPRRRTGNQSEERFSGESFDFPGQVPVDRSRGRNGPTSRDVNRDSFPVDQRNLPPEQGDHPFPQGRNLPGLLERYEGERERRGPDNQGPRDPHGQMERHRGPLDGPDRRSADRGMHGAGEPPQGPLDRPHDDARPHEGTSEYVCAHIRNVPYSARWPDIAQFFNGLQIVPGGIHIMVNSNGRPSGQCFIEFVDAHNARLTEERRLHKLKDRPLQVNACSKAMMIRALEQGGEMLQNRPQHNFGGRGRGSPFGPRGPRFQGDMRGPAPGQGPQHNFGPRGPHPGGSFRPPFEEPRRMDDHPPQHRMDDHPPPHRMDDHPPPHRMDDHPPPHRTGDHPPPHRMDDHPPQHRMDDHPPQHPHDPGHSRRSRQEHDYKNPEPSKEPSKEEASSKGPASAPKATPPDPSPKKPQPEAPKEAIPEAKEKKSSSVSVPTPSAHMDNKHKGCVVTATNLPLTITVDAIGDFFKGFSTIKGAIKLDTNEATGKATGQAKIVFTSPSEANRAIKERNNRPLNGRIVRLHVL